MKKIILLVAFLMMTGVAWGEMPYVSSGSVSGAKSGSISGTYNDINFSQQTNSDFSDQVPNIFTPANASGANPCLVSISVGGSISGGGVGFGHAYVDEECQVRESVRLMAAIMNGQEPANQTLIREVACQSKVYWDAMERTAHQLNDERYRCTGPRPDRADYVKVRDEGLDVQIENTEPPKRVSNSDDCAGKGIMCDHARRKR